MLFSLSTKRGKAHDLQSPQRIREDEQKKIDEASERIQAELTQGLDDPAEARRSVGALHSLGGDTLKDSRMSLEPLTSPLDSLRCRRRRLCNIAFCAGLKLSVLITLLMYNFMAG